LSSDIETDLDLEIEFDNSLNEQLELLKDDKLIEGPLVGGSFCGLGHSSSFHNSYVRKLRKFGYNILCDFLITYKSKQYNMKNIEILPDRQCLRPKGLVPYKESWHRDLSPLNLSNTNQIVQANINDYILGGWINCNKDQDQFFKCVPGTHIGEFDSNSNSDSNENSDSKVNISTSDSLGFSPVTKEQGKEFDKTSVTIRIAPGHMLLFNQTLMHCVNATKLSYDMKRVYVGYRISNPTDIHSSTTNTIDVANAMPLPLIRDIEARLLSGAVVPLKSGQMPPMYPKLWLVNWPDKLISLSNAFPDTHNMKETRVINSKRLREHDELPNEGEHLVLKRFAPAILPIVPYPPDEIALYIPHSICKVSQ